MPSLAWLDPDYVRDLLVNFDIAQSVDEILKAYPDKKVSIRSLKIFMRENGIRLRMESSELEDAIRCATNEVGGAYGRKMMKGYLESKNVRAGVNRIGQLQQATAPQYHENRRNDTQRQLNPGVYCAPHFGYNIHVDQNEKLGMYNIVFVIAVDGCSCYIVAYDIMPRKNNITIYSNVYCKAVVEFGLWDQLIADGGMWSFMNYVRV